MVLINLHRNLHEKSSFLSEIMFIRINPYLCHLLTRYQSTIFPNHKSCVRKKGVPSGGCLFFARGGTEPSARGVPARAFVHKMFIKSPEACFLSGELSLYLLSCKVLRRRLSARDQKGTPVKIRDYSRSCKPRCVPHTL